MKIAILSFYSGQIERGVENWVGELTSHLSAKHSVTIYQAGKLRESLHTQVIDMVVDWQNLPIYAGIKRKLYLDYYSRKIAQFTINVLKKIPKDTDIIIPTNGGWQSILCKIYCIRNNKKLVIVGHSGIGWDDYLNVAIKPHCFVALTNYQKNWAQRVSKRGNIVHIPNGVDTTMFTPEGKKAHINLTKPIILLPSALIPSKQIEKAITAVSLLRLGSLVVLGDGADDYKKKLIEMGNKLLKNRFMLSQSPHEKMPAWYRAADVVTFPSLPGESFGLVVLESLSCNKPVVVNNDPIRKEIVENAGVLTNIQNENEYANALKITLSTDYGNLPRVQAEKFSWDLVADKYQKLIESL